MVVIFLFSWPFAVSNFSCYTFYGNLFCCLFILISLSLALFSLDSLFLSYFPSFFLIGNLYTRPMIAIFGLGQSRCISKKINGDLASFPASLAVFLAGALALRQTWRLPAVVTVHICEQCFRLSTVFRSNAIHHNFSHVYFSRTRPNNKQAKSQLRAIDSRGSINDF